jgi:glycosyltransferase involved in cell wall biosynthesis
MCRALGRRHVDVTIATTDADGPGRLAMPLERTQLFHDVPTIVFRRQFSEAYKYSAPLARWLDANVSRFDLVHIHAVFSHASMAAAAACRKHGVPYVVRPLGTLTPWSLGQKRVRKRLAWRLAAGRMMRHAAAVHYTSADEQRATEASRRLARGVIVGLGADDALLNRGSLEPAASLPPFSPEHELILSRLLPTKGVAAALSALLTLLGEPRFNRWRIVVAGDGDPQYVAQLKRLVDAHAQRERVAFVGWLDPAGKAVVLHNASLFVLPSSHESFGISVVEALACGVPVVISGGVAIAEDVRAAAAGWVSTAQANDLIGALGEAMADDDERRRRGAAGRALVEARYTWPRIARELEQLYVRLIAERGTVPRRVGDDRELPAEAVL